MKMKWMSLMLVFALLLSGSALAVSLPGLDALSAIATAASPTPLELPEVFEIVYKTAEGELSLSRAEDGSITYVNGETTLVFTKTGDDAYAFEAETLTFEELKERIAAVWQLIEPREEVERGAVTSAFDANVTVLDRKANRFRQAIHADFSAQSDNVAWYTFDKTTGVCLMKETGPDEDHKNAEIVYECVSFK